MLHKTKSIGIVIYQRRSYVVLVPSAPLEHGAVGVFFSRTLFFFLTAFPTRIFLSAFQFFTTIHLLSHLATDRTHDCAYSVLISLAPFQTGSPPYTRSRLDFSTSSTRHAAPLTPGRARVITEPIPPTPSTIYNNGSKRLPVFRFAGRFLERRRLL